MFDVGLWNLRAARPGADRCIHWQIPEPDLYEQLQAGRWFDLSLSPDVFVFSYPVMPDGDAGSNGGPSHNAEAMVLTPAGAPVILSKRTDGHSRL